VLLISPIPHTRIIQKGSWNDSCQFLRLATPHWIWPLQFGCLSPVMASTWLLAYRIYRGRAALSAVCVRNKEVHRWLSTKSTKVIAHRFSLRIMSGVAELMPLGLKDKWRSGNTLKQYGGSVLTIPAHVAMWTDHKGKGYEYFFFTFWHIFIVL
jgi:hypothetical protein